MTACKVSLTMHSWHTNSLIGAGRVLPGRFCTARLNEAWVALVVGRKPLLFLPAFFAPEVSSEVIATRSVTFPQTHAVRVSVSFWS